MPLDHPEVLSCAETYADVLRLRGRKRAAERLTEEMRTWRATRDARGE